jgi:hypothetical protein
LGFGKRWPIKDPKVFLGITRGEKEQKEGNFVSSSRKKETKFD